MRRFANIYIVLFFIDATISLVDELFLLFSSSSPLPYFSSLRYFIAYLVIALSVAIYLCLGIDRRLPKRVLLPLTLYAFWCALGLWPLSGVIGRESLGLMASIGQLLVGGFAVFMLRRLGSRYLLCWDLFLHPLFSWRNTLGFTIVNLFMLPVALVFATLALTGTYLDQSTAGFMRLSPVGIYMAEQSYHLDQKEVRLAAMIHIGREGYYEELIDSLSAAGTIILAEGVTDQDQLLDRQFNYNNVAGLLGLSSQEMMQIDGNLVDFETDEQDVRDPAKPDIIRADIDINRFKPKTIAFLNVLGRTLFGEKPLAEGYADYNKWAEKNITPSSMTGLMADILDKRNGVVIASMVQSLKSYDTIVIPWGAMHMPAIEAAVLEQGFTPGERLERLSLDFRTIPYAALWEKLSGVD